ncbi:alpha-glucosidase-like isoform X2 [Littorina saxatilis]|uniref:Glycosyl hydrolase family 13 catalytic domain-containing protein n=1 Tax=Littorina saxatilis TaxID=31220 RepID=A0AAN9G6A3_9CAEN
MAPEKDPDELKKGFCWKLCQSRLCLVLVFLGMAAGIAVSVPMVLLSKSLRERFAPDMKWWQKTIVYQIYPRSFQDSDDDGVGDLRGITSRLDHFQYLNVKTIWLSPFYPSPMRDFGYDVSNYVDVDPKFGNLSDFDDMLKTAHGKDLRVVIDFVAGHTSSDHPWFQLSQNRTSPYEDYYIWANGTTLPNRTIVEPSNWMSVFGNSSWQWSDERRQYYYHAFLAKQPTLNYRNPTVVEEMKNVIRFWMDRGVDGIRVDAIPYIMVSEDYYQDQARNYTATAVWTKPAYYITNLTKNVPDIGDIVKGWREVLDSYEDSDDDDDKSRFMIVELYDTPEVRNRYFEYGADMPFNFDLVTALDNHYQVHGNFCAAICIRDAINNVYDNLPKGKWANFVLSNHDNRRAASRMGELYVDAVNMVLLTLRGTPTTYYGEEIGMEDIFVSYQDTQDPFGKKYGPEKSRDPERSPMQWDDNKNAGFTNSSHPWLAVHPNYTHVNVEWEKNSTNTTTLKVYRDLAILREEPSLQYGLLKFTDVNPDILSYLRSAEEHPHFLVVINFGQVPVTHDFPGALVNRGQGRVKVVTSQAANEGRFAKDSSVPLTQIKLQPGDGLVLELAESGK